MKNILQAKQWVLSTLLMGGAKLTVNGGIYKDRRPTGSTLEDIVINAITMDSSYLQDSILNVNIYVPFITVKIAGQNQLQINHDRLEEVATAIIPLLTNIYTKDFNMTVVGHRTFEEPVEKASYLNLTINLKAFN